MKRARRFRSLGAVMVTACVALVMMVAGAQGSRSSDICPSGVAGPAQGRPALAPDAAEIPGPLVSRQEFARMIVMALQLPVSAGCLCPYTDVAVSPGQELYPDHYVAVVAERGLMHGMTLTLFAPEAEISRSQAVAVLVRSIDLACPGLLASAADPISPSADLARAEAGGLLTGVPRAPGEWDPSAAVGIEEARRLISNLLRMLGSVA
jgi:hypothetical protein